LGVGGIILQKGNNVFVNERGQDLPRQIAELTGELQGVALDRDAGPGVPLLVAVDHEGDGNPLTHLREGFTPVPSAMALGATYDPDVTEAVGRVVGGELSAVGVNLLLGPVLDVLADPRVDSGGDIGTRAFGGDPHWVGRLGAAYVEGVHRGSGGRVATVAKHFPGHGRSDRSTDDEVATVPKSVDELSAVELRPFAAVTSASPGDPDAPHATDAMMTSHIRFRSLSADGRFVTEPVSFDREVLGALMATEGLPFGDWRDSGGLLVVDSLGVRAVRRYFNPNEDSLPNREIARRALMAGNDVLVLAQFAVQPDWSEALANIEDTLAYFDSEYRLNADFRSRVDDAALRILRRKAAMYPDWSVEAVAADPDAAASRVGTAESQAVAERAARAAVTELRALDRPTGGDRIVVVSDYDRVGTPWKLACPYESCGLDEERWDLLQSDGAPLVEALILDRFGPRGTGIVRPEDVTSVTFCQLRALLSPASEEIEPTTPVTAPGAGPLPPSGPACDPSAHPDTVSRAIGDADWVLFAFADLSPTDVRDLRGLLLPQASRLARAGHRARLGVLSFGPPYYVDQTNFFHLDAYYAAYSKIPASIEAAVEALFGLSAASGALPVDYEDANLILAEQLSPDPGHVLPTRLLEPSDARAESVPARIVLEVGPVLDRNGHTVPDGTVVRLRAEPARALQDPAAAVGLTVGGNARVEGLIAHTGPVAVAVSSGAARSELIQIAVPKRTPDVLAGRQAPPASAALSGPGAAGRSGAAGGLGAAQLLFALAAAVLVAGLAVALPAGRGRTPAHQLRLVLSVAVGALAAYVVYGMLLTAGFVTHPPGLPQGLDAALVALIGAAAGLAGAAATGRRTSAQLRMSQFAQEPGTTEARSAQGQSGAGPPAP
jgi:beta-N-acetylhexosaminidase